MKKILTCDYCPDPIPEGTLEKVIFWFITPEGKPIERVYHLKCYCKSIVDKAYLSKIQNQICAEAL